MNLKFNDLAYVNELRTENDKETIAQAFIDNLHYIQGSTLVNASKNDLYLALSYTVRDRIFNSWFKRLQSFEDSGSDNDFKIVGYLSAEFLPGPHLANNMVCLGIMDEVRKAMLSFDIDLDELCDQEEEPLQRNPLKKPWV